MKMRKTITALLAAALCIGVVGVVWAQPYSTVHMVNIPVNFRSQRNDVTLGLTNRQIQDGYVDSSSFTRQGKGVIVGGTTGTADTTAPISLVGLVPNPASFFTGADSVAFFRFSLIPTSDCAATTVIDSLYVIPQVSADGGTWECANLVKDGATGCVPYTAASTLTQSIPALRITNSGTASILFHSAISGRTSADVPNIGTWPYVRFIVLNDISASATAAKHSFSARLTGWSGASQR
jgi:hypothetical protein